METIIKDGITSHLLASNLLSDRKHGFLKSRSCTTCQFDFLNLVAKAVDSGQALVIVYLDLSKAFDRVPHLHLISKLRSFGIDDPLLSWLKSYLAHRSQVVLTNGHISKPKPVTSGVIQGSVLGPLLFLMYINDALDLVHHGTPFLFADDIKIVYSFNSNDAIPTLCNISADLAALDRWCHTWRMSFSTDKCEVLTYKFQLPPGSLNLGGSPIASRPTIRDLGLIYSCSLKFSEHAAIQAAKARRSVALLFRSFRLRDSIISIYKSHIRPLLEYCPIVFSNMTKFDRVAIESVQRRFTKQLLGWSTSLSYRERCQNLNLDPLWLRRLRLNLVFLYNLLHNRSFSFDPVSFSRETPYLLRHRPFTVPSSIAKSAIRSRFFLLVYSKVWNKLPITLRASQTKSQFLSALIPYLSVTRALQLSNMSMAEDIAYERGPDF